MGRRPLKMVGIAVNVPAAAEKTLDRQADARGIAPSRWAGMVFDIGFAAVCAREKSMPATDADLDAICGATLLLWTQERWDTASIGKALGVPESTVVRILDGWAGYRRAQAGPFLGGA